MPAIHTRFDSDSSDDEEFKSPLESRDIEAEFALAANRVGVAAASPSPSSVSEDDDDDDAPPEAVSASAAFDASVAERQRLTDSRRNTDNKKREKRKRLDEKRVNQTKNRRKAQGAAKESGHEGQDATRSKAEDEEMGEGSSQGGNHTNWSYEDPPLLPQSIIDAAEREQKANAAAAEARLLAKVAEESAQARKRKFDANRIGRPKRPKDVYSGSARIRVLSKLSASLPPRSTHRSEVAKEAWLKGRKSKKPMGQRKAWKSGFSKR